MRRMPTLVFTLILGLLWVWVPGLWAASLQYTLPGTGVVFADSGGNVAFTQSNKGTNTGQSSDRYDKGAGAQPSTWELRCTISLTGTLTLGQTIAYYIATSDGTNADGVIGTTGAALTAIDKLRNLLF